LFPHYFRNREAGKETRALCEKREEEAWNGTEKRLVCLSLEKKRKRKVEKRKECSTSMTSTSSPLPSFRFLLSLSTFSLLLSLLYQQSDPRRFFLLKPYPRLFQSGCSRTRLSFSIARIRKKLTK